jgi:hypothetical protein
VHVQNKSSGQQKALLAVGGEKIILGTCMSSISMFIRRWNYFINGTMRGQLLFSLFVDYKTNRFTICFLRCVAAPPHHIITHFPTIIIIRIAIFLISNLNKNKQ